MQPLLTVAAISVTVFSAVGVAALTGMLPQSSGSAAPSTPVEATQPAAAAPAPAPVMAAPAKPKPRPVLKTQSAPRASTAPVEYRDYAQVEPVQKPVVQPGVLGRVESVREVNEPGEAKGLGAIAGGVAGAVLGHQVGNGRGKKLATVLGAAGGAFAGNHIEKQARTEKRWDIVVRLDDGRLETLSSAVQPFWNAGDRVRLHEGRLQPV